jgi:LysM repeat protein
VVQEGQALWQIAAHYEVKLPDILLLNNMSEDDFLHPGDEVIVRLADDATPPPTPTPPLTYTVREGDNPWIIAYRYQIDLDTFLYLNSLSEDDVLHAGNEVRIRLAEGEAPPPTPTPKLTHRIKEGDTAWSIAAQYGLEIDELLAMNGLGENPVLQVGEELAIRATPTPEATATPEVTDTATPTPSSEPEMVSLAVSESPATEETVTPTSPAEPTAATATPEVNDSEEPQGGGLLYIASLLVAGAGLLVFVGVVMRRV